jgi:hypothetical protein
VRNKPACFGSRQQRSLSAKVQLTSGDHPVQPQAATFNVIFRTSGAAAAMVRKLAFPVGVCSVEQEYVVVGMRFRL